MGAQILASPLLLLLSLLFSKRFIAFIRQNHFLSIVAKAMREPSSRGPLSSQSNRDDDNSKSFYSKRNKHNETRTEKEKKQDILYEIEQAKRKRNIKEHEAKERKKKKEEEEEQRKKKKEQRKPRFVRGLQDEVFEHIDKKNGESASGEKLVCWSFENFHQKRKFCAATREKFFEYYSILNENERHHYEIIRDNEPCHLYFDLEFDRDANADVDGVKSTDALLDLIKEELYEKHNVTIALNKHVVELESIITESNVASIGQAKKFSRHVIVRLPGAAFKSNIHVGKFVKDFWNSVCERRASDERCEKLFIRKEQSETERQYSIIDLGVYTRNRAFRLFLSSKAKKKEVLQCTRRFWTHREERDIFYRSLVTNIDKEQNKKLIEYHDVTVSLSQKSNGCATIFSGHGYRRDSLSQNPTKQKELPCAELVEFVLNDFDSWSDAKMNKAAVRSWVAFPDHDTLILNLVGNRYCENIKRQHKSNNVMLILDFQRGVYHQKCHDPDCKGMNPQLRELPVNMLQRAIINGRALPFEREEPKCESDDEEFWQSAASAAERLW